MIQVHRSGTALTTPPGEEMTAYEGRDIKSDGRVLITWIFTDAVQVGPNYFLYGEPPGPWMRQVRELPDGQWETIGGRYENGKYM
jgi:hypothetical protein